jgi:hypothetical protein
MNYIISKEEFQNLKTIWKKKDSHSSHEMVAYNLLRGFDASRGFSPITNPRKLANGMNEWKSLNGAKLWLEYKGSKVSSSVSARNQEKRIL